MIKPKKLITNRHRGKVIQIYDNGAAAVQFKINRAECTRRYPPTGTAPYFLGMKGMVGFVRVPKGYALIFTPFKKQSGGRRK